MIKYQISGRKSPQPGRASPTPQVIQKKSRNTKVYPTKNYGQKGSDYLQQKSSRLTSVSKDRPTSSRNINNYITQRKKIDLQNTSDIQSHKINWESKLAGTVKGPKGGNFYGKTFGKQKFSAASTSVNSRQQSAKRSFKNNSVMSEEKQNDIGAQSNAKIKSINIAAVTRSITPLTKRKEYQMPHINTRYLGTEPNEDVGSEVNKQIFNDPQLTRDWLMQQPNTDRGPRLPSFATQTSSLELEKLKTDMNQFCCDCHAANPDWISVNNGIFLCIQCAGTHRSYGVNISFVRSLSLDKIEDSQIEMLRIGGNRKFQEFVQLYRLNCDPRLHEIQYITKAAQLYRMLLQDAVKNQKEFLIDDSMLGILPLKQGRQVIDDYQSQETRISRISQGKKQVKQSGGDLNFIQETKRFTQYIKDSLTGIRKIQPLCCGQMNYSTNQNQFATVNNNQNVTRKSISRRGKPDYKYSKESIDLRVIDRGNVSTPTGSQVKFKSSISKYNSNRSQHNQLYQQNQGPKVKSQQLINQSKCDSIVESPDQCKEANIFEQAQQLQQGTMSRENSWEKITHEDCGLGLLGFKATKNNFGITDNPKQQMISPRNSLSKQMQRVQETPNFGQNVEPLFKRQQNNFQL